MQDTVATLPRELRDDLREPLGKIVPTVDALLEGVSGPVIAVGDVVTGHLLEASVDVLVAIIDGRTERRSVDESLREKLPLESGRPVPNEAGTLSGELVAATVASINSGVSGQILTVDGEEDLAALPAILAAPQGAVVVYGQPGEGMVRAVVTEETQERVRQLLAGFDSEPRLSLLLP